MGWYAKAFIERLSYDQEMAFLRNYLKQGLDVYDYSWMVDDFLEEEGVDSGEMEGFEWLEQATPEQLEAFKKYVQYELEHSPPQEDTTTPAYQQLDFRRIQQPGWLVHFTDDAHRVAWKGFEFGHEEVEGLGLTTWKSDQARKKYPGFNFAFDADSKYATWAANAGKYGQDAVVFWGSGIVAYHWGDEEDQVIFWGPSVRTDMIFPLYKREGEWLVEDDRGRVMKQGEFDDCVNWIQNNYRMLQQIEQNEWNYKREQRLQRERQEQPVR